MSTNNVWFCKIGTSQDVSIPNGADFPMRKAVESAFRDITGKEDEFCFSGWGQSLDEAQLAVVEYRLPDRAKLLQEIAEEASIHAHVVVPETEVLTDEEKETLLAIVYGDNFDVKHLNTALRKLGDEH